jgi:outer membrane protein insertion porin family
MKSKTLFIIFLLIFSFAQFFSSISRAADVEKTVKSIDVKGNKTVSSLTILAKVKSQVGQPLSSAILNEDLKRLYGLGFFTDVRIEQEDYLDGVKVMFLVVEKPVLSEIRIEGNKKVGKDAIKKEMQSTVGDFVDQKRVRDDVDAVRKLYEKKGFSEVKIDNALDVNSDTNQAILRVIIDEGTKVRIRQIQVIGNKSLKTGDILGKIKTKKMDWWGWFHSGYLKEEDLAEDIERIKSYYDENGFSDVEVTTDTEGLTGKESGDIILKITINEGKKYLVGDVQFKGNEVITTG